MRILADDQFHELTEHIKKLEAENPSSRYSDDITDQIEKIHNKLMMAGIELLFADHIPSKYAVIDKEILWYGSMNLVSNIKEDDDEMRIVNGSVAKALVEFE